MCVMVYNQIEILLTPQEQYALLSNFYKRKCIKIFYSLFFYEKILRKNAVCMYTIHMYYEVYEKRFYNCLFTLGKVLCKSDFERVLRIK